MRACRSNAGESGEMATPTPTVGKPLTMAPFQLPHYWFLSIPFIALLLIMIQCKLIRHDYGVNTINIQRLFPLSLIVFVPI